MQKRTWVILIVLAAMLVPMMAAQAQGDEVVTITWWGTERGRDTAQTRDLHFQLARAFEAQNPNIQVAVALFPSRAFNTRIATAVAGGEAPDIWYTYYAPDVAEQGFLENLTPYIEASGINPAELWFPIGQQRAVYEGQYYGVPRDASAGFIAYNKDMFDAAGLEYPQDGWTVDEYRELANALTDAENDQYGVGAIVGGEGCMLWSSFSFNLGTDVISPDGKQLVGYMDTPEAADAFRYCLELVTEDQVTAPAELQDQYGELVFLSGNVAMQHVSNWELPALNEQADFNWGVVSPPRYSADEPGIAWTDAYAYYMWSGSEHKEEAWKFLEWLSGPEAQQMAAEAGVWSPNGPAAWEALGWDEDPILSVSFNELQKETYVPNYLRSQYYWDCAYAAFDNVRVRWIQNGERDLESMLAEEVATAQFCLDDNYGN
ncbi:MAG: sugar ABC transporter substrate-binding protein [Anaerolineae bacterium]|nr:sugar ABC transporter substrate-binding protein [Anaerolineae bacterium]